MCLRFTYHVAICMKIHVQYLSMSSDIPEFTVGKTLKLKNSLIIALLLATWLMGEQLLLSLISVCE